MQNERQVVANPQPRSESTGRLPPSTSPFIIIITHPKSQYSFYHPTMAERLNRPRHYSKDPQPMPKAAYCSSCRDKHNYWRCDSNLGSLRPQSSMFPLDHCNLHRGTWVRTTSSRLLPDRNSSRESNLQPSTSLMT